MAITLPNNPAVKLAPVPEASINAVPPTSTSNLDTLINTFNKPITLDNLNSLTPGIQAPQNITVPTINIPDFSKFPVLESYLPKLQHASQASTAAGLEELRKGFAPQYELERERLNNAGLLGSGIENEQLRRLTGEQRGQERQFIGEQNARLMEQETQEMQALREMNYNTQIKNLDMQFQSAMQKGDWEMATQTTMAQLRMDTEQLKMNARQIALGAEEINRNTAYNAIQAQLQKDSNNIAQYEAETGRSTLDLEEKRYRVAYIDSLSTSGAQAGYQGDELIDYINTGLEQVGLPPVTPAGTESNINEEATPKVFTNPLGSTASEGELLDAGFTGGKKNKVKTVNGRSVVYSLNGNKYKRTA